MSKDYDCASCRYNTWSTPAAPKNHKIVRAVLSSIRKKLKKNISRCNFACKYLAKCYLIKIHMETDYGTKINKHAQAAAGEIAGNAFGANSGNRRQSCGSESHLRQAELQMRLRGEA